MEIWKYILFIVARIPNQHNKSKNQNKIILMKMTPIGYDFIIPRSKQNILIFETLSQYMKNCFLCFFVMISSKRNLLFL